MTKETTTSNPGIELTESAEDRDLRWIRTGFFFFGAIAVLGLAVYAAQYCSSSSVWAQLAGIIGSGLLIASASFLLGALLGFIFAIPRALQGQRLADQSSSDKKSDTATSARPELEYQVNTNLEQISDWLTKIIVGIGLVQLGRVPEYARRLGDYFSNCLGHAACSPAIAVTLILAFLVFGFLAGYLVTRLYVTGALKRAEAERKAVGPTSGIPIETKDYVVKGPADLGIVKGEAAPPAGDSA